MADPDLDIETPEEEESLPPLTPLQEQLIQQHLRTADKEAYKVYKTATHALNLDDLQGMARWGLMKAVRRWYSYCEDKGYSPDDTQYFFTFSRLFMKGTIMDSLRKEDWATRSMRQKSKKLRAAGQDRGASVEEMAAATGLSEKDIHETIHDMSKRPVSVEGEEIDAAVVQTVESSATVSHLLEVLVKTIRQMDPVAQTILALHYFEHCELQEIAKILGMTEHHSSRLHTESVIAIREALADAMMGRSAKPTED